MHFDVLVPNMQGGALVGHQMRYLRGELMKWRLTSTIVRSGVNSRPIR
jgi:hypothetical protein